MRDLSVSPRLRSIAPRSTSVASFVQLNLEDFLAVIKEFPEDFEKFCQARDNLRMHGACSSFDSFCDFCKRFKHSMFRCPLVNYVPNRKRIIAKSSRSEDAERGPFQRRKVLRENMNSLEILYDVKQSALAWILASYSEEYEEQDLLLLIERIDNQDRLQERQHDSRNTFPTENTEAHEDQLPLPTTGTNYAEPN